MTHHRLIYSTHQRGVATRLFRDESDLSDALDNRVSARLVTVAQMIKERGLDDEDEADARAQFEAEVAGEAMGATIWEVSSVDYTTYHVETTPMLDICKAMVEMVNDWNTWAIVDLDDEAQIIAAYENAPDHNYALWRAALRGDLPADYLRAEGRGE